MSSFIVLLVFTLIIIVNGKLSCPTWTVCHYDLSGNCNCSCGTSFRGLVQCNSTHNKSNVLVGVGFCITLNKPKTTVILGSCRFNIRKGIFIYQKISSNPYEIDGVLCGYTNRTGQLCGQCADGYSPPVYSYYPQCVRCSPGTNNWPKYLAVSLLPLTAFLLVIIIIRFRAATTLLNGYILLSQLLTSAPLMRFLGQSLYMHPEDKTFTESIYMAIFSIWNLDFFRLLYTPFCLHPNATTMQVLSLDYIIAVYPLVLIILTYILVTLHYYNCRLVVWMWKPFISCFARCRRQWDIQNSLVDAFATFLLLSYVKFLSVSFDILTPASVWDVHGNLQHWVLYYDGSVEYLGREHIPYVLFAVSVLMIFTILPILVLCIYPYQCSQRFMNHYNINSPALNKFMDTFQGYYKDGTNETRDYRCFAAMFLILRILFSLSLVAIVNGFGIIIIILVTLSYITILSTCQPYKKRLYGILDIFFMALTVLMLSALLNMGSYSTVLEMKMNRTLIYLLLLIPVIYTVLLMLYYFHSKSERMQTLTKKIKLLFTKSEDSEERLLLPYRLRNV